MKGFQYHHLLAGSELVTRGWSRPRWTLIDLGRYPAAIPGKGRIEGEVYALDAETLAQVDRLEGCPDLYRRATAVLEDGQRAIIYQLQPAATPEEPVVIPGGAWREWCGHQAT